MINFFVKAGRPSKEEKALAEKIQKVISSAEANGDEELLSMVKSQGAVYNLDGLKKMFATIESRKTNNNSNDNNTNTDMVNKGKTNSDENAAPSSSGSSNIGDEVQFEETINMQTESPLQQPVIERQDELENYKQEHGMGGGGSDGGGGDDGGGSSPASDGDEPFEEPRDEGEGEDFSKGSGGNLKDLPPDTKRKAILKTSEVVAKIYSGALPILPKLVSKISEAKLERMSWNNELDLNMRLELPDGGQTTIGNYIREYNDSLDKALTITPDQQEDFRKCLKDVLEEKQVAMTPTQRLISTVGAHAVGMFMAAIENTVMMRKNLEHWKEVHEENKKRSHPQNRNPFNQARTNNNGGNNPPPDAPATPPVTPVPDKPSGGSSSADGNMARSNDADDIQSESEEMTIKPESVEEK